MGLLSSGTNSAILTCMRICFFLISHVSLELSLFHSVFPVSALLLCRTPPPCPSSSSSATRNIFSNAYFIFPPEFRCIFQTCQQATLGIKQDPEAKNRGRAHTPHRLFHLVVAINFRPNYGGSATRRPRALASRESCPLAS